MKKCKVVGIANQKGGVGKTTTTLNLGAGLSKSKKKVLLVDFDPQGNLSDYLGHKKDNLPTITGLINCCFNMAETDNIEKLTLSSIRTNKDENLDYIPSDITLSGAEQTLFTTLNRERLLKNILFPLKDKYDYILIDSPPSLGLLSINVLVASDEVIIPVQAQNFALDGLVQFIDTFRNVKVAINPTLRISGLLLTMVNHTNISKDVEKVLREKFKDLVFKTNISNSTSAPVSTVEQKSLLNLRKNKLGEEYKELAKEYLER